MIRECTKIIKMACAIDQPRRKNVSTKDGSDQLPSYLIRAHLCKIKADYLRVVFECLDGINGLLC